MNSTSFEHITPNGKGDSQNPPSTSVERPQNLFAYHQTVGFPGLRDADAGDGLVIDFLPPRFISKG
uniref:Uncharacterized protein n=1 Tax=Megaselia scalaris TaxID=36166 RepID=T1H1U4_MEGSC